MEIVNQPPAPIALAEIRRLCSSGRARSVRECASLSVREIARQLGVDAATVSRWERGINKPTGPAAVAYLSILHALAQAEGRPTL